MRPAQLFAAATLAVMLSTTIITLACALGCEQVHPAPASAEHCHEATTKTRIATGHDCGDHSAQTGVSIGRTEPSNVFSPGSSTVLTAPSALTQVISVNLVATNATSPPELQIIPLRI